MFILMICSQFGVWSFRSFVTWKWPLGRCRSFKVTECGTTRKLICDFLLLISTNLPPILHRFQVMAD